LNDRLSLVRCAVEAVYHRHNASAILRSCDAFGVHHVHLVGADGPPSGAARGAERWLALHAHRDVGEALATLRDAGVDLWVADLADGPTVLPEDLPLERPVCLWFGAELVGVSDEARRAAKGVVSVPMRGMAQSLNVSVAAAITLRPVAERARALGQRALLSDDERERTLREWLARDRITAGD
jgi:tRNA (guanosine-2'-O-)-methyltransferase